MTPDELRALADAATPGPWQFWTDSVADGVRIGSYTVNFGAQTADARLIALAPDLARLCAELGEALTHVLAEYDAGEVTDGSEAVAYDALAKLAELEARS